MTKRLGDRNSCLNRVPTVVRHLRLDQVELGAGQYLVAGSPPLTGMPSRPELSQVTAAWAVAIVLVSAALLRRRDVQ